MDRVEERESIKKLVLLEYKCKGLIGAITEYGRLGFHGSAILTTETLIDTAREMHERLIQLKAFGPEQS